MSYFKDEKGSIKNPLLIERDKRLVENAKAKMIEKFAHIYSDGSACDGCKYENYATCGQCYERCIERLTEMFEKCKI